MPPKPDRQYYVYIMTNRPKTLYVGVTNNLARRSKKVRLIESLNPRWRDLSTGWYEDVDGK